MVEYSTELGIRICEALASHDGGLRSFCKKHDWAPCATAILDWRVRYAEFGERYSQAREQQLVMMAEDIVDISNDDSLDPSDKRTRINARQWLLSKLVHRVYGDKLDVTSNGEQLTTPSHLIDARVQSIIMQARQRKAGFELPQLDDNVLKLLE